MNTKLFISAAIAAFAVAGAASAAEVVGISVQSGIVVNPSQVLITDFNSNAMGQITDLASGFTFTQDSHAYTLDGAGGGTANSAPPPGETAPGSFYETVEGGGSATLTSAQGLHSFSFYMGSPDEYNGLVLTFFGAGGSQTLTGNAIWGGSPPGTGNQGVGYTVTYYFAPDAVHTIQFTSSSNSFEFDKLRGAVPEPASWALMIGGFGLAGGMLRRRKAAFA